MHSDKLRKNDFPAHVCLCFARPGWEATLSFFRLHVNAVASTCRRVFLQHGGTSELWRRSMTPADSDLTVFHRLPWKTRLFCLEFHLFSPTFKMNIFLQLNIKRLHELNSDVFRNVKDEKVCSCPFLPINKQFSLVFRTDFQTVVYNSFNAHLSIFLLLNVHVKGSKSSAEKHQMCVQFIKNSLQSKVHSCWSVLKFVWPRNYSCFLFPVMQYLHVDDKIFQPVCLHGKLTFVL